MTEQLRAVRRALRWLKKAEKLLAAAEAREAKTKRKEYERVQAKNGSSEQSADVH